MTDLSEEELPHSLTNREHEDEGDESDVDSCSEPAREEIWQQNAALCKNFDELKHLYIQSIQLNLRLQATCTALRKEKESMQKTLLTISESDSSRHVLDEHQQRRDLQLADCHQKTSAQENKISQLEAENRELLHKLELAKALEMAAADQDSLLKGSKDMNHMSHDKDAVIFDMEQAIQQLEELLRSSERKRCAEKRDAEEEIRRLQDIISQKEKQEQLIRTLHAEEMELKVTDALLRARQNEEKQRDVCRAFENEIADLRALLTAVEQSGAETELRHLNTVSDFIKEKEVILEEFNNCKERCKMFEDSLVKVQKELYEVQTRLEESNSKLRESQSQAAIYRNERDEVQRKLEVIKCEMAELVKMRENDRLNHFQSVEEVKQNCNILLQKHEDASNERRNRLCRKIKQLQKKLKDAHKQIARLTFEYNELLIHRKECEAQVAAIQNVRQAQLPSTWSSSSVINQSYSKSKAISAELNQLAARQSKFIATSTL